MNRSRGYLQVLPPLGPLHLFEQQSEAVTQESPTLPQVELQDGSPEQNGSLQSAPFAQSSSAPLLQISNVLRVQSSAQLSQPSSPSQVPSPQQNEPGETGTVVQVLPPLKQRASAQPTGLVPSPSPQQ